MENYKIVVKHTSIIINDYEWGDNKKLENYFSVYNPVTHSCFYKGLEYDEVNKRLILPRGLDVYFLENEFNTKAYIDRKYDECDNVDLIKIKYKPRDEVQRESLNFMSGSTAQYRNNRYYSQLSLNLNTGKGKTYCSIANAAAYSLRSIIITSTVGWLEQWRDCILEYTDVKPREIYFIEGSPSIHRLLKRDISQYKFILVTHATLRSYGENQGWDKITELFKYLRVGIKYYDEAHRDFDNICRIDFHTNTYKTYYITATPLKSDEAENFIYQMYLKNVPSINLFDENNDPHTKYIAIQYTSKPTPLEISKCRNQYGLDRNRYTNYLVRKENPYKVLMILLEMLINKPGKILIYIGVNDAIEVVREWIIHTYPYLEPHIGVYNSLVKDNKEQQLEKKIILSTTKSCGAAVDIKGLKSTIVFAEPFKSEVLARQTLGRTRDPNTYYYDMVDMGFNQTKKYYYQKLPIFNKYATGCSNIKLSPNQLDEQIDLINRSKEYPFKRKIWLRLPKDEIDINNPYFGDRYRNTLKKQVIWHKCDENKNLK